MIDKNIGYLIYKNYKNLSKSIVKIFDGKIRRVSTISAKVKVIKDVGHKQNTTGK